MIKTNLKAKKERKKEKRNMFFKGSLCLDNLIHADIGNTLLST